MNTDESSMNTNESSTNISLRDYFAAEALQGVLAMSNKLSPHLLVARIAYEYADAMLEARR